MPKSGGGARAPPPPPASAGPALGSEPTFHLWNINPIEYKTEITYGKAEEKLRNVHGGAESSLVFVKYLSTVTKYYNTDLDLAISYI